MVDIAALYQELDPLRPLEADEHGDAMYVDWQARVTGNADTKSRLVRTFVRNASAEHPITRLLTGHSGSGKTTELNRVSRSLRLGAEGRKVFVSTLLALRWLDMEDLEPEDLVLQLVRQLVSDLKATGMRLGQQRFAELLRQIWAGVRGVRLEDVDLGVDPLRFSFTIAAYPSGREDFRRVLRGQLPTVFDLVNRELLPAARKHLARRGYDDVLMVVDDLDKIRGKESRENLFVHNSAMLQAVHCSMLLTVPIDLAYSPAQGSLRNDYGSALHTVPLVSVASRTGTPSPEGEAALIEILGRRAWVGFGRPAEAPAECAQRIFADRDLLLRVVRLSGGHIRSLFVLVTELLDWVDDLPLDRDIVERYVARTAKDLARALFAPDKDLLRRVAVSGEPVEDPRFFELVRRHYVFAYEAGLDDYWYGLNPLLHEIEL